MLSRMHWIEVGGMIRFFSLFLPDFLVSVVATSLEDAKVDSQVQWKRDIHSLNLKSFFSSCDAKLKTK
jgi:hypothetical protein